jgi:hypothetical protein
VTHLSTVEVALILFDLEAKATPGSYKEICWCRSSLSQRAGNSVTEVPEGDNSALLCTADIRSVVSEACCAPKPLKTLPTYLATITDCIAGNVYQ